MSADFEEPAIPAISPRTQRVLLAGWISLGVHAALIALVQVAPPAAISLGEPVIEARLMSKQVAPSAAATPPLAPVMNPPEAPPAESPLLMPSETTDALPVAKPEVAPPVQTAPPAETATAAPQPAPVVTPAPAAAITSAVDLTYYSAREVDVHPSPLRKIEPDYPEKAERQNVPGCVVLRLKHEVDGHISNIEIVSVKPPGFSFEVSALEAFSGAPFSPAFKQGHQVRAVNVIVVYFDGIDGRRISCDTPR